MRIRSDGYPFRLRWPDGLEQTVSELEGIESIEMEGLAYDYDEFIIRMVDGRVGSGQNPGGMVIEPEAS